MLAIAGLASSADLRGDRELQAVTTDAPILALDGLWIRCSDSVTDACENASIDYKACALADPNSEWNLFVHTSPSGAIVGQSIGKVADGSFTANRQELGFTTGSDSFFLRRSGSDLESGEFLNKMVDLAGDGTFDRIIATPVTAGKNPFCLVRVKLGDFGGVPTSVNSPQ